MSEVRIESLFPEYCNLFGDHGNLLYLKACLPQVEFIETPITDKPRFLSEPMDLIYMGPMSEPAQEKVIAHLMPYREEIGEKLKNGMRFFFTGNATEVLFKIIKDGDREIPGLGLLDFTAVRDFAHRYNANFLGEFDFMPLLGCRTQFTMVYGDNSKMYFSKAKRGIGINRETDLEGIWYKNFIGTSLVGPLLPMNPGFTLWLLEWIGAEPTLAYPEAMEEAYEKRLKEFRDPAVNMEKEGDTNQIRVDFTPKALYNKVKSKLGRK